MAKFDRDSLGWQWGKLSRQMGEWFEVISRSDSLDVPNFSVPNWISIFFNFLAWVCLMIAAAWLGLLVYRAGRNYWLERRMPKFDRGTAILETNKAITEWLKQAQSLYEQKNYREACQRLYLAMLQTLHDREIALQKISRTDGEYRLSLWVKPVSQPQNYLVLLNLHERFSFSSFMASEDSFKECKSAFDRIIETQ